MSVITISREFSCGANEVAALVAQELGYEVVDKELLSHIAAEAQVSEAEVERFDEAGMTSLERFLRVLVRFGVPEDALSWSPGPLRESPLWLPPLSNGSRKGAACWITKNACALRRSSCASWLNEDGSSSSVGQGMMVLRDLPALHVRLVAPLQWRVQRLAQMEAMPLEKARQKVLAEDKRRAEYIRQFYKVDWNDPTLYHLTLNVAELGIETTARLIVTAARRFFGMAG